MPCSKSPSPVTGQGTDPFGMSCEIDSACRTGKCRKSSLFPFKTNRPDGKIPCMGMYHGAYPRGTLQNSGWGAIRPSHTSSETERNVTTYRITNFLGRIAKTGKRKKQMTKQTRAPTLQAPNTNNRSHLLTVARHRGQSWTIRARSCVDQLQEEERHPY